MDKKKSFYNITASMISRILLLIAALIVRRLLIRCIGNDVNGLNSLYTSIIGMLAVAELGIGSAIVYSMYKPIVEGDQRRISALYRLYGRLYRIVGLVIFAGGLAVMPFLPKLISDYSVLRVNVYTTFLLSLVSVVLTYLYGAQTSLIEAHKNNYITTAILTIGRLTGYILQALAILAFRSFTIYLICQNIGTILIWLLTHAFVRRKYGQILSLHETVDPETKSEITRNIKAMFMHRIGTVLVNTVDSIIISTFIGVAVLGKYSNYTMIAGVITRIIALFFSPLTSVIGHLCASGDPKQIKTHFDHFYTLNFVLGSVFFLGYYAVIDSVIRLLFGEGLEVTRSISFIIALNSFTSFMRQSQLLFRNASGTFYNDRWKPVAEGAANLILSLLFVKTFPEEYKVVGVIVATIITTLTICYTVEPFVVFRHVFRESPRAFYIRSYTYTAIFTLSLLLVGHLTKDRASLVLNGLLSIAVSLAALALIAAFDHTFRKSILALAKTLRSRLP